MKIGGWMVVLTCVIAACATAKPAGRPDEWRVRLRRAIAEEVNTREQRDQLSRVMLQAVEAGALERLSMAELEAALGLGTECAGNELCDQQGFSGGDWYYLIGQLKDPAIKQLPVLIVGFNSHGYVSRVYTLKTH
jgi:hypothetical protein